MSKWQSLYPTLNIPKASRVGIPKALYADYTKYMYKQTKNDRATSIGVLKKKND